DRLPDERLPQVRRLTLAGRAHLPVLDPQGGSDGWKDERMLDQRGLELRVCHDGPQRRTVEREQPVVERRHLATGKDRPEQIIRRWNGCESPFPECRAERQGRLRVARG